MLKNIRRIFGFILILNAVERVLHAHIYYQDDFLWGYTVHALWILVASAFLFTLTHQRIWAFSTLVLSGILAQGAPMLIFGLDMTSVPFLLFFCFFDRKVERSFRNSFLMALLLIQIVIMYTYNGWSKLNDPILWTNGLMFEFVFYGSYVLNVLPAKFFAGVVIALQLSSFLLLTRSCRRIMIMLLLGFHLSVILFIGLPYFQMVCMLQLCLLWRFTDSVLPRVHSVR